MPIVAQMAPASVTVAQMVPASAYVPTNGKQAIDDGCRADSLSELCILTSFVVSNS